MEGFIYAEDRKKLREHATAYTSEESSVVPRDPAGFVKETAKVVIRLLDTIDHFQESNFKLCQRLTTAEMELEEGGERSCEVITDLMAKNKSLQEYVVKVEKERDAAVEALDLNKIEMLNLNECFVQEPKTLDERVTALERMVKVEIANRITAAFKRGNSNEAEINKIKAKLNKKAVKKTTPKKKK